MRRFVVSLMTVAVLAQALPASAGCNGCEPELRVIEDGFGMLPDASPPPTSPEPPVTPEPEPRVIEDPVEMVPDEPPPAPGSTADEVGGENAPAAVAEPACDAPTVSPRQVFVTRPAFGHSTNRPI